MPDISASHSGTGKRSAMHQFEQMMDPNVLARVVVPRPLNNFLDNLPSEERLASDGPWTLFEPAKKFIIETKDDISEKGKGSFSLVLWLKTLCFSSVPGSGL
jgi:hypothetical protein